MTTTRLDFELHRLGWYSFEQLCRTICSEIWEAPISAFSRGPDGGRDGFLMAIDPVTKTTQNTILQCKHRSIPATHFKPSELESEVPKIEAHVNRGRCDQYIVMTNSPVSSSTEEAIVKQFKSIGVKTVQVFGYESLCETLTQHKSLRALVPRLYGLGDLTEILDERRYAQAEAILASMHDQISSLVPVEAHRMARRALAEKQFALLIGSAGSGKSSIAASLAIGAIDDFEAIPLKLDHIGEIDDAWNPNSSNQLFWLDDVFGATQLDGSAVEEWNRKVFAVRAAIRQGARFIMTSRDYIYAEAKSGLKQGELPLLNASEIVINVEGFTKAEREQILYNHLKLGQQPTSLLKRLDSDDLEVVAADSHFLPELARRLSQPAFTRDVDLTSRVQLLRFIQNPVAYLHELLGQLDLASQAGLGLVHLHGNHLTIPPMPSPEDTQFLVRSGVQPHEALNALPSLAGAFLRESKVGDDRWWQFTHPSLIDAYEVWLGANPLLLHEYVVSARLDELMRTITCGAIGIEGAIVVPDREFDAVITRLNAALPGPTRQSFSFQDRFLLSFLSRRCTDSFLAALIEHDPRVIELVFNVGTHVDVYDSNAPLIRRLLDCGLASEDQRSALVGRLTSFAGEYLDGTFLLNDDWMELFTEREVERLDDSIRANLHEIEDDISQWLENDPESVSSAEAVLDGFEARFPGHPSVLGAREVVETYRNYEPEQDPDSWHDYSTDGASADVVESSSNARETSIFDDLAE